MGGGVSAPHRNEFAARGSLVCMATHKKSSYQCRTDCLNLNLHLKIMSVHGSSILLSKTTFESHPITALLLLPNRRHILLKYPSLKSKTFLLSCQTEIPLNQRKQCKKMSSPLRCTKHCKKSFHTTKEHHPQCTCPIAPTCRMIQSFAWNEWDAKKTQTTSSSLSRSH